MKSSALRTGANPQVIALDPNNEAIPVERQDNFYKEQNSKITKRF